MGCGCSGTSPQPGVQRPAAAVQGRRIVYRIVDSETGECTFTDPSGECQVFQTDVAAYKQWYAIDRQGTVRAMWTTPEGGDLPVGIGGPAILGPDA